MTLFIDSREPQDVTSYFSKEFKEVERRQLPIGDYLIENTVIVERKSVMDLLSSVLDGRYEAQMMQLSVRNDEVPLLFVHGSAYDIGEMTKHLRLKSNPWDIITGAIASATARYGIDVVFSESRDQGFMILVKYMKKLQQKRRSAVKFSNKKKLDKRVLIVTAVLHTSPAIARALLESYGSIPNILNSDLQGIEGIRGIGHKKAAELREVLEQWQGG